jgi:hypothetical protein
MRLIFLHGINQNGRDPAAMLTEWRQDLETGLGLPGALAAADITMPFYGDTLVEAAKLGADGVIAQGAIESEDREAARFIAESLEEQASAVGVTPGQIVEEQERVGSAGKALPQGFPMSRRINAIVSVLERVSPWHGDVALKFLGQAHAYLKMPKVRHAVDAIVDPALDPAPAVIVSHSLGTVIAFRLLRKRALKNVPLEIPLLVTLGSPLTLATVQRALEPKFITPSGVDRWLNVRDPRDFIALNRSLEPPRFSERIENQFEFSNPGADPHAIPGYLTHPGMAQAVGTALGL